MIDTLLAAFSGPGAAFMYVITALLAFGLAVSIERVFAFWIRWRLDEETAIGRAAAGEIDALRSLVEGHPVARLVNSGASAKDGDSAWDTMTAAAALLDRQVRLRIGALATVGNLATIIGLLGTVYGLILAFSGLEAASAVERSARLSEGIATAMATTAYGLLVGIPALASHALLEGKANRILAFCEALAGYVAASRRA